VAPVTWLQAVAVVAAGMGAGAINAIIGSGSLITFPTLLAVGYAPVVANVSNNIGLVPGSVTGTLGYRDELRGQGRRIRLLASGSATGALTGATLLLTLPSEVFDTIVPLLVLTACALMAVQPRLSKWVLARRDEHAREVSWVPVFIAFLAGIYGGYFGAAQGVILLAMLAVFVPDDLQRLNGLKNLMAGTVNTVAAVLFIVFAEVAWEAVGLVALGSVVGGFVGARLARRIPSNALRIVVIVVGVAVAIRLLLR
jgi:uncharacterized protein